MKSLFFSALFLLSSSAAWAFRLAPMVTELTPAGNKTSQTFVLENTDGKRIAVELEVTTREMAADGKEARHPTQDFTVFPTQVSLEPGEKRNVRITYVGEQNLKGESAYRLIASQLKIDFDKVKPNAGTAVAVNFLLQYVASVYVAPDEAKAKLEIRSVKNSKPAQAELEIANTGKRHRLLTDAKIKFLAKDKAGKKKEWLLDAQAGKDIFSENVLAGARRKFEVRLPDDFPTDGLRADISF